MRADTMQTRHRQALMTIYCAFFLAFFIAGAICGYLLARTCEVKILQRYCIAFCLKQSGIFWAIFPLVRFGSLFVLCSRFRIGVFFMPPMIFLRGLSAVFYFSAFCISLPEYLTLGRGIAYFVYMVITLTILIGFGWMALGRLYGKNFGRTSYG